MTHLTACDRALRGLSRRELLNIAWKLGAAAIAQPLFPTTVLAQPLFRSYPFPLGVASGDPLPDSVVLWTRLAPEPLDGGGMPMANVEVGLGGRARSRVSRPIVQKGTAVARPELGHSVHVEADGLRAGARVLLSLSCRRRGQSRSGERETAPAAGRARRSPALRRLRLQPLRDRLLHRLPAHRRRAVRLRLPHRRLHLRGPRRRRHATRRSCASIRGSEIYTLVDYRNRYAQYKPDPDLRAAHASAPFIVTLGRPRGRQRLRRRSSTRTARRRKCSCCAAPRRIRRTTRRCRCGRARLPAGPDMRLYRRLRFGTLIDLSVLDTRQYRSKQACGSGTSTGCAAARIPRARSSATSRSAGSSISCRRMQGTWTVIGQQVPTFARNMIEANPKGRFSMDKWDGYTASRQRLYARLLRDQGAEPDRALRRRARPLRRRSEGRLRQPEVARRRRRAHQHVDHVGRRRRGCGANWERFARDNPHIKYHSARRGYIACTATPAAMRAEFKVLDRVTVADAPERTGGTLVVEAGRPGAVLAES